MLNLDKIKVAFFDFDDTLCIHSLHREWGVQFSGSIPSTIFDEFRCADNVQMKQFINILVEKGVELHLISVARGAIRPAKLAWVKEHYGVSMIDSCTEEIEEKAGKMKEYCESRQLPCSEVLFVDDLWSSVEAAAAVGIRALSPMEVVNFINTSGDS